MCGCDHLVRMPFVACEADIKADLSQRLKKAQSKYVNMVAQCQLDSIDLLQPSVGLISLEEFAVLGY